MQLLIELIPVILFFLTFKFVDIYAATVVGIVSTLLMLLITRLITKAWDKKQTVTLIIFSFFGGMTLYFHDPIFVKWKPTIVFWVFSLVFLGSQAFTSQPLIKRLMQNMLEGQNTIPASVWQRLNLLWAFFFLGMGAVNLYVAYTCTLDVWVDFKFYGITSALMLFSAAQAFFLTKYFPDQKS